MNNTDHLITVYCSGWVVNVTRHTQKLFLEERCIVIKCYSHTCFGGQCIKFFFLKLIKTFFCGRLNEDLEFITGHKPSIFWKISWMFISPVAIAFILVFYLVTQAQEELTYLVWDPNSVSTQAL